MVLKKTKTIKERLIYVYLPSEDMVEHWKKKAQEAKMSLSKFVMEQVEGGIQREDDFVPRLELLKKIKELEEENQSLRQDNRRLGIVVDKLQEDLQVYRLQPFMDEKFQGIRKYEKGLIDLFRKKGFLKMDELWRELGVSPRNSDAVKAISRQLENLEHYGLIKKTYEGWRWSKK
jgi:hypothetical protein